MNLNNGTVLVVSVTIMKNEKVLIVQENKPQAYKKWSFPSGRMEQGEDICQAAFREVKEETGFDVKLTHTTGIYNFISSLNHQVIMFHFIGEIIGGTLTLDKTEILDTRWMTLEELKNLDDNALRDKNVFKQILEQIETESYYSTNIIKKQLLD